MNGLFFRKSRPEEAPAPALNGIRVANYVALLVLLGVLLVYAQLIVVAVLIGVGLGAILAPALHRMHRSLRIPRSLAALLVALAGLALLVGVGWSIGAVVEAQVRQLAERAPELVQGLQARLDALLARYPWVEQGIDKIEVSRLTSSAGGMGAALFKGAWSGVGVISALVFALIIGLYVAVESRDYREGAVRAFPAVYRAQAEDFMGKAGRTLRIWFRAQSVDMAIVGALTSLGLWIVGADYWLLLGLLTGLLGIIPYIGNALVLVFACLIALASDPSRLPWIVGVFILVQQLEGNLILPMVMKGSVQLPAAPLLVFMLLLGTWGGLLGVLIAPPLFALLCLAWRELYLPHMDALRAPEDAQG